MAVVDDETVRQPLLSDHNGQTYDTQNAAPGDEAPDESPAKDSQEPSTAHLLATMGSIWLCTFFAALDSTVVATLSGPISADFKSGTAFSWIASGYVIANAACQPLSGKLTDIYGRRAGLIFATSFFATGTLICSLAQNAEVMILGRVIAGMGGGCLNTISAFVGSDLIPLRKRGVWQGIANIVFGAGMSLGGVYGGFMHSRFNWRYAFYLQIPFIVLGGICSSIMVNFPPKENDMKKVKRVDFLGAFALVTALVMLLLGLNSGGNTVPWNHPIVYSSLSLSLVGLISFVYIEERVASEPIIPMRLLLNRTVAASCISYFFATMSVYTLIYYAPIYLQVVRSLSAFQAGTFLISQSAGVAIGSLSSGFIMRAVGSWWRWNIFVQLLFVTSASCIFATFDSSVHPISTYVYLFMSGVAYGALLTVNLVSLIAAVDHEYQAVATSASYAFRSVGGSLGIAIGGAIFQNLLKHQLYAHFGDEPGAEEQIRRIRESVDEIKHIPATWRPGVIESYVEAMRGVWAATVLLAILTAIASFMMKEHKLHNTLRR
ncbi:Hypothetical protein R9X50_00643500 [Acrodontium crateriforme]|uniref:Major facilitator superfamily (MFS) profile domain-containing protein n=1 Tax=Acrodontium crateriforme TaxID=150365 RepID=A0AAQ3R9V7_9PEZI|nr:Hypothetical protein R9X50_00643500 [Acrodontium crateriforme]